MSHTTHSHDGFGRFNFGDRMEYTGPADPDDFIAPDDSQQPFTFKRVTDDGVLHCLTAFNGEKIYHHTHPASDPDNWAKIE